MVFCPRCGALIPPDGERCPQCGTPVDLSAIEQMDKADSAKQTATHEKGTRTIAETLRKTLDLIPDWTNVLYRVVFACAMLAAVFSAVVLAREYKKAGGKASEASRLYVGSNQTQNETVPLPTKPTREEILFRDIPWGTNYENATSQVPEVNFVSYQGESIKTYSVEEIVYGFGIRFEYTDINIKAHNLFGSICVAGYDTSSVDLFFAYVPVGDSLSRLDKDSALYAASYEFNPIDTKAMAKDLKEKLSAMYGDPSETSHGEDFWGGAVDYTYWYGANDTLLVLCVDDESESRWKLSERIRIVYAWREGDRLLQEASDCLEREAIAGEKSKFGNGNTNGL